MLQKLHHNAEPNRETNQSATTSTAGCSQLDNHRVEPTLTVEQPNGVDKL